MTGNVRGAALATVPRHARSAALAEAASRAQPQVKFFYSKASIRSYGIRFDETLLDCRRTVCDTSHGTHGRTVEAPRLEPKRWEVSSRIQWAQMRHVPPSGGPRGWSGNMHRISDSAAKDCFRRTSRLGDARRPSFSQSWALTSKKSQSRPPGQKKKFIGWSRSTEKMCSWLCNEPL